MPRVIRFFIFLALSIACLLLALWVTLGQMSRYDAVRAVLPSGTTIAGVPVGGQEPLAAGMRVLQTYSQTPIELRVDGTTLQVSPADLGQELDMQKMLNTTTSALSQGSYWEGFWNFLWNRLPGPTSTPLACQVSEEKLHAFLTQQLAPRYIEAPRHAQPTLGDVSFKPGQPGKTLNVEQAEPAIRAALCQPSERVVDLTTQATGGLPPQVSALGTALETLTQVSTPDFHGLVEVYFQDITSGEEVNFAFDQGRPVSPGIAFTGASTIKIPVMVSAYNKIEGSMPDELRKRMELMIDLSDNSSTDEVMKQVLDANIAPVQVTQDMQALGLKDTFLAGFFYEGAPLLNRYQTTANQRTDLSTDPDIYNQTTPADMGRLLANIQRCADSGSGPLVETFKAGITQAECQDMTNLLSKNRKGVLIEAGLPEGTPMARKYGWVTDVQDGLMHTASDAAIVYTPGGNFVLTVYLYDADQLQWDNAQRLVARLATTVDNFYNNWNQ